MYVRRTSAAKATNDSGASLQRRNAAASCKPIYMGIHLRRTICVSKEAMERLPLSNPEGSLMACPQLYGSLMMPAQHFEPGDFTFRNRFSRAASQEVGCGEEREAQPYEPIIDHTKQSWYSSNATSALTLTAEPNRSLSSFYMIYVHILIKQVKTFFQYTRQCENNKQYYQYYRATNPNLVTHSVTSNSGQEAYALRYHIWQTLRCCFPRALCEKCGQCILLKCILK
ncbi:Hypothetical_protein [Hexamita inflata]|uniref:Hypothetical_protein n=1 Tax=Hexamita inflata TaxID=28002 RepID=A0AA86QRB5_9EUKA|nr:Hypothetical protein HINF_LOCUS49267 [Hexamita inflata]CAI9961627.1 Hypothetical protein HINF_LOCUS49272 [Hexamita inflata]